MIEVSGKSLERSISIFWIPGNAKARVGTLDPENPGRT
jgi:hypothetical protein